MSEFDNLIGSNGIPTHWYNIVPDMPTPPAVPLHPATHKPITSKDLEPMFPMVLIEQESTQERLIAIPEEVREMLAMWRPTPLRRAKYLERALGTPAKIYFKYEGASPSGSHKSNTAVAQAHYNKQAGKKRVTTESGAGQWGTSLAQAGALLGLDVTVYMVRYNVEQKPYRKTAMEMWGADVFASPSENTNAGRAELAIDPDCPGTLGIAISEAVEDATTRGDTNYALGSVMNHVLLHQTIIGLEARRQMQDIDEYPDVIIACCGGGSNFGGIAFPFLHDKFKENKKVRAIAVESAACPTLTKGEFRYDLGDVAGLTPLLMMYTLGHSFMPSQLQAGGLRYHGVSPLVSQLYNEGLIEARALEQTAVFEAAKLFARCEGIIPALESAHAVKAAIDMAQACKDTEKSMTILFCLSGHGLFDLGSYGEMLAGNSPEPSFSHEKVEEALGKLPMVQLRWE